MVIISRNAAINIYNKNHKQKVSNIEDSIFETIDPEPIPIEQIVSKDSIEKIINILDQMNSKYSDVMKLKYFNEYSNTEIAKILSIKEDNVRKRLSRGKNILLSKLAKEV